MASPVIPDKELLEVQERMFDLRRQLSAVVSEIMEREREKRRVVLTSNELNEMPKDTVAYQPVGRMFLCTPMDTIKSELLTRDATVEGDRKRLEEKRVYVEKQLSDIETQFREMLTQFRERQLKARK